MTGLRRQVIRLPTSECVANGILATASAPKLSWATPLLSLVCRYITDCEKKPGAAKSGLG